MSDPAILLRKLSVLRDHVGRLRRRRPANADALRDDLDLQDSIAMSLLVSVQVALDVALHIAADEGLGVPATYADGFDMLVRQGWLDADVGRRLAGMAALRNRIAHGYASVDFERIWRELPGGLDAFDHFAAAVTRRIDGP